MGDSISTVENFKLSDFLQKDMDFIEEYMRIMQYLKPTKTKNKVFDMRLRDVQDIKDNLSQGTFEDIIKCVVITEEKDFDTVLKMKIINFWGLVLSIKKQIEDINHMERVSLDSDQVNFRWEGVNGGERLAIFGIYNTLDTLSGGDILRYEKILDLPYSDVFTKMYMNRVKADIEMEMSQLKTRK